MISNNSPKFPNAPDNLAYIKIFKNCYFHAYLIKHNIEKYGSDD